MEGSEGFREAMRVIDLSVQYEKSNSRLQALSKVTFALQLGEVLGIVGESGSGKSTLARALLRLLPRNAHVSGQVLMGGRDLLSCSERDFQRVRWAEISMIFQDAMNSLNPVLSIGLQLEETIRQHNSMSRRAVTRRAVELLEMIGLEPRILQSYPHELSGGMRQRVSIALAFACRPIVVLADEPTTALDVLTQDRVIAEMLQLQSRADQAMIFISHDIALVSEISNKVGVMYAGHLVEIGSVHEVLYETAHPYTMGLLNAFPRVDVDRSLVSIPGDTARFGEIPEHCAFVDRCPFVQTLCREQTPPSIELSPGHLTACHFADEVEGFRVKAADPKTWATLPKPPLEELSSS